MWKAPGTERGHPEWWGPEERSLHRWRRRKALAYCWILEVPAPNTAGLWMNGWKERIGLLEQSWWKHNILVTPFKQFIVFIPFMLPHTANQFGWSCHLFGHVNKPLRGSINFCFITALVSLLTVTLSLVETINLDLKQTVCHHSPTVRIELEFFSPHPDSFHLPDLTHFANFVNMNTKVGSQSKTCTERSQNSIYGTAESSPNDPLF